MARIDPWSSDIIDDYQHLMDEFGLRPFDPTSVEDPAMVMRRGVVVGQRGFHLIADAIKKGEPYAMLTGLMPSGKMHFGHKMVIDQVIWYQRHGADIFIAVADIESYAARGIPFDKARETAVEEYIKSYIALGLENKRTQIYFQSSRTAVKDMAYMFGRKVTWSTIQAIYGFSESTNMSHIIAPLIQVGDILHVQLEKYGGPRPTIVPVGLDQDPHIRFTRDLANAHRIYSVQPLVNAPGVGVFLKGDYSDQRAKELLEKAEDKLREYGYGDMKINLPYRALDIYSATEWEMEKISTLLSSVEVEMGGYGFYPPSATYHRFMTGLNGGKMSSSKPESAIFLSDSIDEAKKKIKRAKTGGRMTVEEQRELGGEPEKCTIFEMFRNHLIEDDDEVAEIYTRCKNGELLCGECKKLAAQKIEEFLSDFQEKKNAIDDEWKDYIVIDTPEERRGSEIW